MTLSEHQLRAMIAAEHRKRDADPGRIAELREQLFEAKVTEWVERQLVIAPPLSQATRDRLAALLSGSRADKGARHTDEAA